MYPWGGGSSESIILLFEGRIRGAVTIFSFHTDSVAQLHIHTCTCIYIYILVLTLTLMYIGKEGEIHNCVCPRPMHRTEKNS